MRPLTFPHLHLLAKGLTQLLLLPCLLIQAPRLAAQDLPPAQNADVLLKELEQITSNSQSLTQRRRADAISRIQSASASGASAVELYVTALDNTKYRENHQGLIEWRQKNQDNLHHSSFQNAAQLQLRYLLLGLQRSDQQTAFAQVPEVLTYLNSLSTLHFLEGPYSPPPATGGRTGAIFTPQDKVIPDAAALLNQPLSSAPIVDWLQIGDLLPSGKDFEASPGNYSEILEKNVKTPLRAANDPRLPSIWDLQINSESAIAKASKSKQQSESFTNERLPQLIFSKLKDTAAIGQPNRAATEMVKLIRSNPSNTSVKSWIESAKALLTAQVTAAAAAAATPQALPSAAGAPSPTPSASVVTTPQPPTTNN